jgi:hypothetical protein
VLELKAHNTKIKLIFGRKTSFNILTVGKTKLVAYLVKIKIIRSTKNTHILVIIALKVALELAKYF